MGLFSGFLKGFSSKTIKDTFQAFGELRKNYVEDMQDMALQIRSMRNNQLAEQEKADIALEAARSKTQEAILKKRMAEERKSEKYMAQMRYLGNLAKHGINNPTFLTRFSGAKRRKSLIGKQ